MTTPNEVPGGCLKAAEQIVDDGFAQFAFFEHVAAIIADHSGSRLALTVLNGVHWRYDKDNPRGWCISCGASKDDGDFGVCRLAEAIRALEGK